MNSIVLLIVIPILIAGSIPLLRLINAENRRLPWLIVLCVSVVMTVAAILFATNGALLAGDIFTTTVGNWSKNVGIELSLTQLSSMMIALIMFCSSVTLISDYQQRTVQHLSNNRLSFFYTVWLLYLVSLMGICMTADAFNMFVFLELSTLCTCILLSQGKSNKSYLVAYRYLLMAIVGGVFYLLGIGIIYATVGSFNFDIVSKAMFELSASDTLMQVSVIFILLGIMIKSAIFPMYFWLPSSYVHAPFNFTMMIASVGTKITLYALYRLLIEMNVAALFNMYRFVSNFDMILIWILIVGVIAVSITAYYQRDILTTFGFCSISSMTIIFCGLIYSINIHESAVVYTITHALSVLGFMTILHSIYVSDAYDLRQSKFVEVARKYSGRMALLFLWILFLAGVPGSAVFSAKWSFLEFLLPIDVAVQGEFLDTSMITMSIWSNTYVLINLGFALAILFSSFMIILSLGRFVYEAYGANVTSEKPYQERAKLSVGFNGSACFLMIISTILLGLQFWIFSNTLDVHDLVKRSSIHKAKEYKLLKTVKPTTDTNWEKIHKSRDWVQT